MPYGPTKFRSTVVKPYIYDLDKDPIEIVPTEAPARHDSINTPARPNSINTPARPNIINTPARPNIINTPARPNNINPARPSRINAPARPSRIEVRIPAAVSSAIPNAPARPDIINTPARSSRLEVRIPAAAALFNVIVNEDQEEAFINTVNSNGIINTAFLTAKEKADLQLTNKLRQ